MYVARHAFVRSVHPERELTMPQRAAKPSLLVDALLFAAGAVVATVLLLALANPFARPDSYYEGAAALRAAGGGGLQGWWWVRRRRAAAAMGRREVGNSGAVEPCNPEPEVVVIISCRLI